MQGQGQMRVTETLIRPKKTVGEAYSAIDPSRETLPRTLPVKQFIQLPLV